MKRSLLLVPLAAAALALGACSTSAPQHHSPPQKAASSSHTHARTTRTVQAPAAPAAALKVPRDLVGKTMGAAKAELATAGFTNVVVAGERGGAITDSDKVISAPEAGKQLTPTSRVRLIAASPVAPPQQPSSGEASSSGSSGHSRAQCEADSSQCYVDGQHCATGSCVNAARGLSQSEVKAQTDQWLEQHPGYCAYGVTGAVAPCSSAPGGRRP